MAPPSLSESVDVVSSSSSHIKTNPDVRPRPRSRRQIRSELASQITSLRSTYPSFKPPHLQILQLGSSAASSTYIRMKLKAAQESGMTVEHIQVASDAESGESEGKGVAEIERLVKRANGDPRVNGLLVQLPLEGATQEQERIVVETVGVDKDVDGFHPENIGHLSSRLSTPAFTPCTPAGVIKLIDSSESAVPAPSSDHDRSS